jgi:nicotinamidase-related amidase
MSLNSTDKGLLTPGNCAVLFIDHQPQMFFGVANIDRQDLLNNVLVLARAAKIFRVPVILTALQSEGFSGNITPQLLDLFPNQTPMSIGGIKAQLTEPPFSAPPRRRSSPPRHSGSIRPCPPFF